jgi:DNA topoisomerase-1
LGADPGSGKPVVVKEGRFGPYVTDGETNASIPRGDDVAEITLGRALELLAERRARGPAPARGRKRAGAKPPAAAKGKDAGAAKSPAAGKGSSRGRSSGASKRSPS